MDAELGGGEEEGQGTEVEDYGDGLVWMEGEDGYSSLDDDDDVFAAPKTEILPPCR